MDLSLACPYDHHALTETQCEAFCSECGRHYPVREGVVCTLDVPDEFYEGAYGNKVFFLPRSERPWHIWPIWLINGGYLWTVRRFVPPGSTVVELGCAAGVRYFGQRYHMVGCDLSLSSLKKLEFYERRVQADALVGIPLPDSSVDAVISSYFWEHIAPELKPRILLEIKRILRPGGKMIFLYDVETKNPLIKHFKDKANAVYERLFLSGDGHIGYQKPAENLRLFLSAGFQILSHKGLEKTFLQSPAAYTKLKQFPTVMRPFFAWGAKLGESRFFYPYTALMRLVDTVICPWLPENWARIDMVVLKK